MVQKAIKYNAKQCDEKKWFKLFCTKYPLSPEEVEYGDNNGSRPDITFKINGIKIGFEITTLFCDEIMRQMESIKKKICGEGERLCKEANLPSCSVSIGFADIISKQSENILGQELFKIVSNNTSLEENIIDIDESILPPGVFWCQLFKTKICPPKYEWAFYKAVEERLTYELLDKSIKGKNSKFKKYCHDVNKCWLLVVAEGNKGSSTFDLSPELKEAEFDTPFEKVFFLNGFGNMLHELKVHE